MTKNPQPIRCLLVPVLLASLSSPATAEVRINEFVSEHASVENWPGAPSDMDGKNPDWIEIHNPGPGPASLNGHALSDDPAVPGKWVFPDGITLAADSYFVVSASGESRMSAVKPSTNFKIKDEGALLLSKPDGAGGFTVVSQIGSAAVPYPQQQLYFSYGCVNGIDPAQLGYMAAATPGAANNDASAVTGFCRKPDFSMPRGFYDAPFALQLTSATPGATLVYTLDGSAPTAGNGTQVPPPDPGSAPTASIPITQSTIIRAAAIKIGLGISDSVTNTYIFWSSVVDQTGPLPSMGLAPAQIANWGSVGEQLRSPAVPDWAVDPNITGESASAANRFTYDDLKSAPCVSVVTGFKDMFGPSDPGSIPANGGIYIGKEVGVGNERVAREATLEYFNPDGDPANPNAKSGFQAHGRVHVFGGSSINRWKQYKLSLHFKADKDAKFDTYGHGAEDETENFILDAQSNQTWVHPDATQRSRADYLRDQVMSDLQNAMGGFAPRGRPVHLFLEGMYWGMYFLHEQPEEHFQESYQGGDSDDWDVFKHTLSTAANIVNSATLNSANPESLANSTVKKNYDAMLNLVSAAQGANSGGGGGGNVALGKPVTVSSTGSGNAGTNANDGNGGTRWAALDSSYPQTWQVDLGAATPLAGIEIDWYNSSSRYYLYTVEVSADGTTYEEIADNTENSVFGNTAHGFTANARYVRVTILGCSQISTAASAHEIRVLEAPPAGGPVSPQQAAYDAVWTKLDRRGFIDYLALNFLAGNEDWSHQNLYASYHRTHPDAKWRFHSWDAEHVFKTTTGNLLTKTSIAAGSPEAIHAALRGIPEYRLAFADALHRLMFNDGVLSVAGLRSAFNFRYNQADSAIRGESARWGDDRRAFFPYTRDSDWLAEKTRILDSVIPERWVNMLANFRSANLYPSDSGSFSVVTPEMRDNATDLPRHGGTVPAGFTLKLHNRNTGGAGTIHYTTDGSDPRVAWTGAVSPSAATYTAPLHLGAPITIKTRLLNNGVWSALDEAYFLVDSEPASAANLSITKIHYHPANPSSAEIATGHTDDGLFEFVELMNIGTNSIDLGGVTFSAGISFVFTDTMPHRILAPGERVLAVKNLAAFQFRYGAGLPVAGAFLSGSLDNSGERLQLLAKNGSSIHDFTYDDTAPWPTQPDGEGPSLVLVRPTSRPQLSIGGNWRASVSPEGSLSGGSPAMDDRIRFAAWRAASFSTNEASDPLVSAIDADPDGDGHSNIVEYLRGTNPKQRDPDAFVSFAIEPVNPGSGVGNFGVMRCRYRAAAEDAVLIPLVTENFTGWSEAVALSRTPHPGGETTAAWRMKTPATENPAGFMRLRIEFEP